MPLFGSFDCSFDDSFDHGCDEEAPVATVATVATLRGVPSLKPRQRPQIRGVEGRGLVPVIGVGRPTGEAALAGNLTVAIEGTGMLAGDTLRFLVGAIAHGAEAVFALERGVVAAAHIVTSVRAIIACDRSVTASASIPHVIAGRMACDGAVIGLLSVRAGAEAVATVQEGDEVIILAASEILRRHLTG